MLSPGKLAGIAVSALLLAVTATPLRAAEHVVLRNGFDLICDHRETAGDRVRLYMTPSATNFTEVATSDIVSTEFVQLPAPAKPEAASEAIPADPTPQQIHAMAEKAGEAQNLDVDLLASVIRAESNGNVHAVSHAGARGLMQLMPQTASDLGVTDSFRADQNINAGTAYLNDLLKRYHDDLALALAAYNAGPAAVAKYHGIPPYRETRQYVARIIHDFNRRKAEASARAATLIAASATVPAGH